jgi:hypothetical protein
MTQEEFIKALDRRGYSYEIKEDKIVVTHKKWILLNTLETLPPGVEFKNIGDVSLDSLETLPPGVGFKNKGYVDLQSLKTISPGVEFRNRGLVSLNSLETLPPGVVFNTEGDRNGRDVYLNSLTGGRFSFWKGNIEGIKPNMLLNKMIELGLFDKNKR